MEILGLLFLVLYCVLVLWLCLCGVLQTIWAFTVPLDRRSWRNSLSLGLHTSEAMKRCEEGTGPRCKEWDSVEKAGNPPPEMCGNPGADVGRSD
jgi:hypothetical protein